MFPGRTESVNFEGDISFSISQRLTNRERKQARNNLGLNKDDLISSIMDLVNIRAEEIYYENLPINERTIRFSFSDLSYNPDELGVGKNDSPGVWTKIPTEYTNIWEWTRDDSNWYKAFGCAWTKPPSIIDKNFWNDEFIQIDHSFQTGQNVKILAWNMTNVTSVKALFQGAYDLVSFPNNTDFSTIEDCSFMFNYCISNESCPDLSSNSVTTCKNMYFGNISLKKTGYLNFPNSTTYYKTFMSCENIIEAKGCNFENCTDVRDLFEECINLKKIINLDNTSKVQIWHDSFGACFSLEELPETLDMSAGTDCSGVFSYCRSLENLPEITWGNNVTTLQNFLKCCSRITEIPNMSVFHYVQNFQSFMSADDTFYNNPPRSKSPVPMAIKYLPSWFPQQATNVEDMFYGCKNIENGITTWYMFLSNKITPVSSHDGCFELCGVDTDEGRKQLDSVPDDWK